MLIAALLLHDNCSDATRNAYDYVWGLFVHGQLIQCQQEAERDAERFQLSAPAWVPKFQLLKAQAMQWRGLNTDASLALSQVATTDSNDTVQKLTLQASVLTKLRQFSAADEKLGEAERLCKKTDYASCGGVPRVRGVFAIDRGQMFAARDFFLESFSYARSHHDQFLETTALVNLGVAALRSDHYDEAADWSKSAHRAALGIGAGDLEQMSSGNLGYAYFELGDHQKALDRLLDAEERATKIGDLRFKLIWLEDIGLVYQTDGEPERAAPIYRQALELAKRIDSKFDVVVTLEELTYAAIDAGKLEEASAYVEQLAPLAEGSGNRQRELLVVKSVRGKIAAARRQDREAEELLRGVEEDHTGQTGLSLGAGNALAQLYERENRASAAETMYRKTLATFESARADLKNEESRLPFLANAGSLYDSYIHFLVSHGKSDEALAVADRSRALTLAEGLGLAPTAHPSAPNRLNASAIAQKAHATLLFYWLGKQQSYLWAITPAKTALFVLPPQQQISTTVDYYTQALTGFKDPLAEANSDARSLYTMLVAPAAHFIPAGSNVVICADGALSKLNFETLLAPGPASNSHYWIEDATVAVAPSLSMLAAARPPRDDNNKLLMIGDAVSSNPDYPELPLASLEMRLIKQHFTPEKETILARRDATPASYLASNLEKFAFIHFVAHGTASRTDPLESAIILSPVRDPNRDLDDSFKLYARDIIRHPIDARLVTISACYGSGARTYAGEGLVGLSWSFLRAGAHNVIAALWNVSDESTPRLMDLVYQGIQNGLAPSDALRKAKLAVLHTEGEFRKPFYWAPFQLCVGR